ncbi:phage tail tape measure protein [Xenophilus aerolatus]|nr:phage tail tape measure protein [Xenophilus aerolatus]
MSDDLRVALVASFKDQLVGPLRRALDETEKRLGSLEKTTAKVGATADQGTGKVTGLARAADALGRTSGTGKLQTDLANIGREADNAAKRTRGLRDVLAQIPNLARNVGSAFAGFQAAKMVMAQPLQRAADYEVDLARLSNIAYSERNTVEGRQAGQREMDMAIRAATLQGVKRDDALLGLKTVIAAGTDRKDAMAMLPAMAKFSIAGEAQMQDVANIAIKAQQTFGIAPSQMPGALQMALNAGKLGQFEFKDMAHWLPEQMALAKNMLGMQGLGDLSTLLTANQFAAKTAGSNNGAGNNLVNFLAKINSTDTAQDAKKLGIDLSGSLAKARESGTSPIDAFINLMRQTADRDPQYKALQKRLQAAQDGGDKGGQVATLTAMSDLMMGKSVGKLVQDRQALLGLLGILNDPEGFKRMRDDIRNTKDGVDVDQATLMATTSMKNQQGENAMLNRQFDALQGFGGALGDAQVKIAELSGEYPKASAALEALKLAAMAAAASLAAMSFLNLLKPKGVPGGPGTGAPGTGAPGGPGAAPAGAAGGTALLGATGAAIAVGGSAATGFAAGIVANNKEAFAPKSDVSMLSAMSGDTGLAAAIMSAADSGPATAQPANWRGKGFADPRLLGIGEGPERLQKATQDKQVEVITQMTQKMDQAMTELKAVAARPIVVQLDGREIASAINAQNGFEGRRQ